LFSFVLRRSGRCEENGEERREKERRVAVFGFEAGQASISFSSLRCVSVWLYSRRCFKRAPSREAIGLEKKLKGKRKRERELHRVGRERRDRID